MSLPAISSIHFETSSCETQDQFAIWREVISATHSIERPGTELSPFHISFNIYRLNQIAISSGSFSAQSFARPLDKIRHDDIDHIALFAQGHGTRYVRIGDDEDLLRRNDIHIVDLAQAESSVASAGSSGTLYLPRALAEEILPGISTFHGRILRDSMASLLARHILNLGDAIPDLPATATPSLVKATLELTSATLQSAVSGSWETNAAVEVAMRHRVERHIESRLQDPELTPTSVARACGISRSTLYRLFEPHGGVGLFVKRRRLARIRSILIANVDRRSLTEISEDYGFRSGAHFSREFRREFGTAPSDIRAGQPVTNKAYTSSEADLGTMLRSLRF